MSLASFEAVTEVEITEADRGLLGEYGETMLYVQLFELSLLGLVQAQGPEPADPSLEAGLQRVEELFSFTAGRLKRLAKIEDADFGEKLAAAVNTRNTLAHSYLVEARVRLALEESSHAEERNLLRGARQNFDAVRRELDRITEAAHREAVIDPTVPELSLEDFRAMRDKE